MKFQGFLWNNKRSWENQKPQENRQKRGLCWASPFTMHLVCTLFVGFDQQPKSSPKCLFAIKCSSMHPFTGGLAVFYWGCNSVLGGPHYICDRVGQLQNREHRSGRKIEKLPMFLLFFLSFACFSPIFRISASQHVAPFARHVLMSMQFLGTNREQY